MGDVTTEIERLEHERVVSDADNTPYFNVAERIAQLQAELDSLRGKCTWTQDKWYDYWETSCGQAFVLTEGGPIENGEIYCYHCGRLIEVVPAPWEDVDDDGN